MHLNIGATTGYC